MKQPLPDQLQEKRPRTGAHSDHPAPLASGSSGKKLALHSCDFQERPAVGQSAKTAQTLSMRNLVNTSDHWQQLPHQGPDICSVALDTQSSTLFVADAACSVTAYRQSQVSQVQCTDLSNCQSFPQLHSWPDYSLPCRLLLPGTSPDSQMQMSAWEQRLWGSGTCQKRVLSLQQRPAATSYCWSLRAAGMSW